MHGPVTRFVNKCLFRVCLINLDNGNYPYHHVHHIMALLRAHGKQYDVLNLKPRPFALPSWRLSQSIEVPPPYLSEAVIPTAFACCVIP